MKNSKKLPPWETLAFLDGTADFGTKKTT